MSQVTTAMPSVAGLDAEVLVGHCCDLSVGRAVLVQVACLAVLSHAHACRCRNSRRDHSACAFRFPESSAVAGRAIDDMVPVRNAGLEGRDVAGDGERFRLRPRSAPPRLRACRRARPRRDASAAALEPEPGSSRQRLTPNCVSPPASPSALSEAPFDQRVEGRRIAGRVDFRRACRRRSSASSHPLDDRRRAHAGADAERDSAVERSRRSSSSSAVPRIIAPVAPSGWPMAIAPPFTLTLFGSSSNACM